MSLIKALMGRRQFMIAVGLASTCALTCKKLAGFKTRAAMAADTAAAASIKTAGNRCPHLLSPLKIRNFVLKNRIMHTVSTPTLIQGPENFPADAYRNHYSNMAKNAAIVTINTQFGAYPKIYTPNQHGPSANFSDDIWQDIPPVQNYVERLMDDIHCEGALICFAGAMGTMAGLIPPGGGNGAPGQGGIPGGSGTSAQPGKGVEEIVKEAKEIENKGFDVYRLETDNLDAIKAVRNATNLIIMASFRGHGDMSMGQTGGAKNSAGVSNVNQPGADELELAVEEAKRLEGLADFMWIRAGSEHPNSFCQDKDRPYNLAYAEAIKKAGVKIFTCPSAGFHDPIQNDEFIASGKTDMVGMTTPFFADPELVRKVAAGRADDVVPCYQCQNCHGISMTKGPWYNTCDVNPTWATPAYKLAGILPPLKKKTVAVIGGGPGGMKAALVAAERGHKVTIFEKDAALGGLLRFSDHSQWGWNQKVFKDYLACQVKKAGVDVMLNTTATPEIIKSAGYDTVLVATGAAPVVSRMPGADARNVFNILTCYSDKNALGKNVVMIGAGKIGIEAAIGMVKDGHNVVVLTIGKEIVEPEAVGPHNMYNQEAIYKNHPDFSYVLEAMVKSITGGKVTYRDSKGAENSVQADSIVIYAGLKPRTDEAEKFIGSADEVLLLGDCTGRNGTIQKTVRNAFFVASQV